MQKWEYTCIKAPPDDEADVRALLNKLGQEGWELVSVVIGQKANGLPMAWHWVKRPLS